MCRVHMHVSNQCTGSGYGYHCSTSRPLLVSLCEPLEAEAAATCSADAGAAAEGVMAPVLQKCPGCHQQRTYE